MIDYIKGSIVELNPSEAVLDNNGLGFSFLISVQTYEAIKEKKECMLFVHHYIREDDEEFFGFASKEERKMFRLLISVSGIGVASARMMLSSMSTEEIENAILSEDIVRIKSIKGIGAKSAQRLVLELKDKIIKGDGSVTENLVLSDSNGNIEQATTALVLLGFSKQNVSKALRDILKKNPSASVEEIIKDALKSL